MFNEAKEFFEKRIGETYGTYTIIDHLEFIEFLKKEIDFKESEPLEYDLEEMIDEFIQKDSIYKPFH